MDLKHCEFITGCSSLVGVHGCLFKAMATKISLLIERKAFCSCGLEKTSMDANEATTACYELNALNPSYTAAIATFLLRFHSRN